MLRKGKFMLCIKGEKNLLQGVISKTCKSQNELQQWNPFLPVTKDESKARQPCNSRRQLWRQTLICQPYPKNLAVSSFILMFYPFLYSPRSLLCFIPASDLNFTALKDGHIFFPGTYWLCFQMEASSHELVLVEKSCCSTVKSSTPLSILHSKFPHNSQIFWDPMREKNPNLLLIAAWWLLAN